ncbi:Uncharacterized protein APZ42_028011 [Daphnia magna]|uniref:Uncharacterized protein n=1 Tax=Daphnia magna TaxID=35525 RepID=A0A164QWI8_9CRUS|nr:Uncharacterized protein APZ42_028011 [Daphnia magna]
MQSTHIGCAYRRIWTRFDLFLLEQKARQFWANKNEAFQIFQSFHFQVRIRRKTLNLNA